MSWHQSPEPCCARDELSQAEPANPNAASDAEPVDVMVRKPMYVRDSFRIALHVVQDVHDMRTSSTNSTRYRYVVRSVSGTRYMVRIGHDTT